MQLKLLMNGWSGEPFFYALDVLDFSCYFFASRTRMYMAPQIHVCAVIKWVQHCHTPKFQNLECD
jgi:hypothetical protein